MSTLTNRISWLNDRQSMSLLDNSEVANYKDYGAVKEIPLSRVVVVGNNLGYDEPLLTADGAVVSATAPGQWGQLYRAGRY